MSTWRNVIKALATGPRKFEHLAAEWGRTSHDAYDGITKAKRLGLIEQCEGRGQGWWRLTPLGMEYAEGRVVLERRRSGCAVFAATWLRSLPQDIRIPQPPQA